MKFTCYDHMYHGWCVFEQSDGESVFATKIAGPFKCRRQADDLLGPLLTQDASADKNPDQHTTPVNGIALRLPEGK